MEDARDFRIRRFRELARRYAQVTGRVPPSRPSALDDLVAVNRDMVLAINKRTADGTAVVRVGPVLLRILGETIEADVAGLDTDGGTVAQLTVTLPWDATRPVGLLALDAAARAREQWNLSVADPAHLS